MSTPDSVPIDAGLVAQLAREFWSELTSGDAGSVDSPLVPEPSSSDVGEVSSDLAHCSSVDQFSNAEALGVIGQTIDVGHLVSVPGQPVGAGYPGVTPAALPSLGLPGGSSAELGHIPYYLQWGQTPSVPNSSSAPTQGLDVPTELNPLVPVQAPLVPSASLGSPFGSPNVPLEDPRGGPATLAVAPGITPEVSSGVAPASVPGPLSAARRDFPILNEVVNGRKLVWLDNAATTQKPQSVIDRLSHFYEHENSNIHRAAHTLAARSTDAYEGARSTVSRFINAGSAENIVFVRGATEAINLVAQTWGRKYIKAGDEIVITWIEHHSNIVPWQLLASEVGAKLVVVPVDSRGQVLLHDYERLLGPRTKLVSITHVSNALGTVVPVEEMVASAHRFGAKVLVDGAQAVSHMPVDVRRIDADWYTISGHKVFAPTGIGVLYGKPEILEAMPPWQGGGNMIGDVTFERTIYMPPPARFEAGTGNIADAVGLGAALEYLERLGMVNVAAHEHELIEYATQELQKIPGLRIIGTAPEKAGVISFVLSNRSVQDTGAALAAAGIAVRAGHHCAQPALRRFGLEATVRPSFALYNNREDIDALVTVVKDLARET